MKRIPSAVKEWKKYYKLNSYYHKDFEKLSQNLVPSYARVLEFGSKCGELLSTIPNKEKVGVDDQIYTEYPKNKTIKLISFDKLSSIKAKKFDSILLSNVLSEVDDVQHFLEKIRRFVNPNTRIVVFYYNFLWKPILDIGEKIGLKLPYNKEPNWLSGEDIENFFFLESYQKIKSGQSFLIPFKIPLLSPFVNKFIAHLPIFSNFCLTHYVVFRSDPHPRDYSVSIIIPARNEAGNIKGVLKKIPALGTKTEVIFVEGHSKDDTYQAIISEIKKYKGKLKASVFKQTGVGKGDAVRLGFAKAKNEILMILDADLTVDPGDLYKFYETLASGKGEFVMGSRLVYPMGKLAMRTLNIFGNKFFSVAFSFLLDEKVKDTLCGTKAIMAIDYKKIEKNRHLFGDFDPFGDFDLIFGAAKLNLKIVEIPIRYKDRVYGETNISRFRHGFLLLKMVIFAAQKIKFI
jgi:hypothetical protein